MKRLSSLFSRTLLGYLWQEFLVRYRFKFVLPKKEHAVIDGIYLDLTQLSLKVRNRILLGLYEAHERNMCREFLTADDAVLEIGGAIGFISLFCQKNLGIRNYTVFEANPATLAILRRNYELNGLRPSACHLALAPSDGPLELEVGTDFWENSLVCAQRDGGGKETVSVPGAPFAQLLRTAGREFNVLIVDVEGAEQFIPADEIPLEVNKIIIEMHPHVLGPEKTYDFIAALIKRGYYVAREESGTFVFLQRRRLRPTGPPPVLRAYPQGEEGALIGAVAGSS